MPLALLIQLEHCNTLIDSPPKSIQSFTGIISEENEGKRKFYIQDIEDGALIELKFYFDKNEDLHFKDFDFVEASGIYSRKSNTLKVESIYPIDKVSVTSKKDLVALID